MPHKTYEDSTLAEKAIGKVRQYEALLREKSNRRLPEGFKAISLCFDDFPQSASENGAAILEEAGLRGTFYGCFGTLGNSSMAGTLAKVEDIIRLHKRGHDIGCHTHDHINCSFNPIQMFIKNCEQNIAAAATLKIPLTHFCYPQGGVTLAAKRMAAQLYRSARSGFWGINGTCFDAHCLKSVPLYEGHILSVNAFIDRLGKDHGWLIFYTHDVSDSPSEHGISTQSLKHIIATCQQQNIPIYPVSTVIKMALA